MLNWHVLSIYNVSGSVLGAGVTILNMTGRVSNGILGGRAWKEVNRKMNEKKEIAGSN